jgi:general secretion pathway protein D
MKATTKKRLLAIGLCTPAALATVAVGVGLPANAFAQRPQRGPVAPPPPGGRLPAPAGAGTATTPAPPAPPSPPASSGSTTPAGALGSTTPGPKGVGDPGALPQFEKGMEFTPLSPNNKVTFSMEDADLSELVRTIAQITGKRFIFGGKVRTIKASVYSPEKVTVAEAYQAFLSILETNGLTVVPHGRFLKIVEVAGIASQVTPTYAPGESAPAEDRFVTRMHRLNHVSADDVSAILTHFKTKEGDITTYAPGNLLIITDTGANIRRMMQIVEDIDVGNAGDQIWIEPIHYASASDVEKRINDLFDVKSSSSSGGAKPGGDKKGGEPSGGGSVGSGDLHVSKIVADDRSNSLVIVATERAYLRVLEFIKRIDVPNTGEGEIHVFSLQHADATELTKTLNEIINGAGGASPAGAAPAGGARPPSTGGGGAIAQGIFEGGVKVSADPATNSIVVTSSQRDYAALRNVVDRLDQARRQVFIEAVIMDLQLKRSDGLGVTFHAGDTFSAAGQSGGLIYGGNNPLNTISLLPTDPTALQGFALGVRGPGIPGSENLLGTGISIPAFGTFISAIASTGDTDLLSTPHILATDNIPAEISVGDNVPTQTNTGAGGGLGALAGLAGGSSSSGLGALGGLGLGGFTAPRADVGTKIKIKPHLNDSNEVRLELSEEISEAGATLPGALGAVPIAKRTATTQLVVKDQQTVVIGGLIRSVNSRTESKVPFLGDIPVVGALFRNRTDTIEKRNLILILTPYIIREQSDLRTVFERKMQERQQYLDHYFVFSDNGEYEPPKDYSRANGLLENVRQAYLNVEERRHLDDLTKPREVKTHTPGEPLEMPASVHSAAAASSGGEPEEGAAPARPATTPARERRNRETSGENNNDGNGAPPVNVNPPARSVDRQER